MITQVEFYKTRLPKLYRAEWRWRLYDGDNGKVIGASTEGYYNFHDMRRNFERVTGMRAIKDGLTPDSGMLSKWTDAPVRGELWFGNLKS